MNLRIFACIPVVPKRAFVLQMQKCNCTLKFLMTFFPSFPPNSSFFTPVFHPHTYTVTTTTTTAQFTFYNCKLHFTTAEIVISYTLKYALLYQLACYR